MSAGIGAAFASIPNLIVNAVDERQTGEATGVNTIVRNVGSAVGAQVGGTIIAAHVLASGLPSTTASRSRSSSPRSARSSPPLGPADPGAHQPGNGRGASGRCRLDSLPPRRTPASDAR